MSSGHGAPTGPEFLRPAILAESNLVASAITLIARYAHPAMSALVRGEVRFIVW
jgi:hypothetical protein